MTDARQGMNGMPLKPFGAMTVIFACIMLAAGIASSAQAAEKNSVKAPDGEARFDFDSMRQDELMQIIEILGSQIDALKRSREKYKDGVNPEYGEIQSKIEELEAERAAAYKRRL